MGGNAEIAAQEGGEGAGGNDPAAVLLLSGKRKSGKDFLAERLAAALGQHSSVVIVRLSAPLKKCYADDRGLDYQEMMTSGQYKEQHRRDMIKWSEEIRNKDYGYFCRAAIDFHGARAHRVWVVSDCRRTTDLRFFEERFSAERCRRVRICASEEVRRGRGWVFQAGVDDAESECGLDGAHAHFTLQNNGDTDAAEILRPVIEETVTLLAK